MPAINSPGDEVPAGDGGAARALQGRDAAIVRHAPGRVPIGDSTLPHSLDPLTVIKIFFKGECESDCPDLQKRHHITFQNTTELSILLRIIVQVFPSGSIIPKMHFHFENALLGPSSLYLEPASRYQTKCPLPPERSRGFFEWSTPSDESLF